MTDASAVSVSSVAPASAQAEPSPEESLLHEKIVGRLRTVYDPEIPVNLYDLGLIYRIAITPAKAVAKKEPAEEAQAVSDEGVVAEDPAVQKDAASEAGEQPGGADDENARDKESHSSEEKAHDPLQTKYDVRIDMTLTSIGCPLADQMPVLVSHVLEDLDEVSDISVEIVWDPPWDRSMMSEEAQLELGWMGM